MKTTATPGGRISAPCAHYAVIAGSITVVEEPRGTRDQRYYVGAMARDIRRSRQSPGLVRSLEENIVYCAMKIAGMDYWAASASSDLW